MKETPKREEKNKQAFGEKYKHTAAPVSSIRKRSQRRKRRRKRRNGDGHLMFGLLALTATQLFNLLL